MTQASVPERQPSALRWWILGTLLLGTLMGSMNNTIANVALPEILDEFKCNVGSGVWVITAYAVTSAVFMPVFGRLGDMYHRRSIYLGGLLGYAVTATLCMLAPSMEVLICARVLQGIAIAPVLPTVMSMVAKLFPASERGRAMGLWAAVAGLGLSVGAPLGGFLTSSLGWRSIFWAMIPVALVACTMAGRVVPANGASSGDRFDWLGAMALIGVTVCAMSSLTVATEIGLASPVTIGLLVAVVGLFVLFVVAERRIEPAFVDLSLFGVRPYVAAAVVAALQVFCLFGTLLLIPLFVVELQGHDAAFAGVLLFFLPATMMAVATVAGHVNDRYGSRRPAVGGMFLIAVADAGLGLMSPLTSSVYIVACLIAMGVGIAFVQSPVATAVTYVIEPARIGMAVGFFNMFRFVGGAFATTIFGASLQAIAQQGLSGGVGSPQEALSRAFAVNFFALAAVSTVALAIATRIVDRSNGVQRPAE